MDPARRRLVTAPFLAAVGCRRSGSDPPAVRPAGMPPIDPSVEMSPPVAVELSALDASGRAVVPYGRDVVELRREDGAIRARSLLCTHWGCRVQWNAALREYACPCHEGRYDEQGMVLAGPPAAALREIPVRVQDGRVLVGAN